MGAFYATAFMFSLNRILSKCLWMPVQTSVCVRDISVSVIYSERGPIQPNNLTMHSMHSLGFPRDVPGSEPV